MRCTSIYLVKIDHILFLLSFNLKQWERVERRVGDLQRGNGAGKWFKVRRRSAGGGRSGGRSAFQNDKSFGETSKRDNFISAPERRPSLILRCHRKRLQSLVPCRSPWHLEPPLICLPLLYLIKQWLSCRDTKFGAIMDVCLLCYVNWNNIVNGLIYTSYFDLNLKKIITLAF